MSQSLPVLVLSQFRSRFASLTGQQLLADTLSADWLHISNPGSIDEFPF